MHVCAWMSLRQVSQYIDLILNSSSFYLKLKYKLKLYFYSAISQITKKKKQKKKIQARNKIMNNFLLNSNEMYKTIKILNHIVNPNILELRNLH